VVALGLGGYGQLSVPSLFDGEPSTVFEGKVVLEEGRTI
jgi:hypothetical protein